MDDAGAIREAGWRQGSLIVSDEANPTFRDLLQHAPRFSYWIVVSQDCDLLHHSFKVEPQVELLGCNEIPKADGNFTAGKNPRRLHFVTAVNGRQRFLEACVCDRFCIERSLLASMRPSDAVRLDSATVHMLADWIARRYSRSAFPDAFNDRLRAQQTGFKRLLVKHGEVFSGIYFELSSFDELGDDETYHIRARLVMTARDYEDESRLDRALAARNAFEIGLQQCKGLEVISVDVLSETEFTLADLDRFVAWDGFDYLSNSDA